MKKLSSFLIGVTIALNSFGQELGHDIKFVFIDSIGDIITPDIWVKSKQIDHHTLNVIESKTHHLKIKI